MPQGKVTLTQEQKVAVEFKGNNMLVSAAAGSGKTFVLVERIIRQILSKEDPCDIERLLVVTFTEKAALEMKERIRRALQEAWEQNPQDLRIARQLSLLERAQISTIHSFCLSIVRRYFYRVDLDPGFRVLDPNEAELLRYESVDEVFEALYGLSPDENQRFLDLVAGFGGREIDEDLKQLVLSLHEFLGTQPSPQAWLDDAVDQYKKVADALDKPGITPEQLDGLMLSLPWTRLLLEQIESELAEGVSLLTQACNICRLPGGPEHYLDVLVPELSVFEQVYGEVKKLLGLVPCGGERGSRASLQAGLGSLEVLRGFAEFEFQRLPSRKKGTVDPALSDMAKELRDKAKKCHNNCASSAIMRPVLEVLQEIADSLPLMETFVDLVTRLDRVYTLKKKAISGVDFTDLERYTLEILRQEDGRLAAEIRACYDYVFVDEYQDTNPVQDEILTLVSRGDNMFMVGDIKQSIYRFRLADPNLFLAKYTLYTPVDRFAHGAGVPGVRTGLSSNFRSRKQVIDAVNFLFGRIMERSVAEIDYTEEHRLNLGASYPQAPDYNLATELILLERDEVDEGATGSREGPQGGGGQEDSELEQYEALEKEALLVAAKIKQLVDPASGFRVWDAKASEYRHCMFRDIAVLMRSTKGRANVVLDIFQQCGIPAYAELGTGYFRAREVEVALSLLAVIDNPRQDIPLAAVLRSPVVGLTPKQLAVIKAMCPQGQFYDSVKGFASLEPSRLDPGNLREDLGEREILEAREAAAKFLDDLDRWRTMARRMPLAHVLWAVLGETGYYDYVGGLPGGAQRQANLNALINRAMEFDKFGRHGLFRFLRFIDRIRESKGDLGSARALGEQEDVVRVLSVHKSKGLEFPVVFVLDLGKQFNMEDLRRDILFHKDLGIGAMCCDLANKVKYPSLPYKAAQVQIRKDNLAEEMRILYVAKTRAKEKLFLVGSARGLISQMDKWQDMRLDRAVTFLDWICPAVLPKLRQVVETGVQDDVDGPDVPFDIQVFGLPGLPGIPQPFARRGQGEHTWAQVKHLMPLEQPGNREVYDQVRQRLEWEYPYKALSQVPAKMSVSELKSKLDLEDEFREFVPALGERSLSVSKRRRGIERGIAVHALLARMDLSKAQSEAGVRQEIERLCSLGFLDSQYINPEDASRIAEFFNSDTGKMLVASPHKVRREVPFTIGIAVNPAGLPEEHARETVVVQGVIDAVLDTDDGLWIIDYKTDSVTTQYLPQVVRNYTPQVAMYAYAAEQILGMPVKRVSLVFLTAGKEVAVDWRGYLSDLRLDDVLLLMSR